MKSPFTIESDPFADPETYQTEDAFEFEAERNGSLSLFEAPEAPALTRKGASRRTIQPAGCAHYERGEVQKSRTPQGHLTSDVIAHARGLLIADFVVDWRTPRASLKREKMLKDWLATITKVIRANPKTTIRILGFSDCVGNERNNRLLRKGRAIRVRALFNQMLGNGLQWNSLKSRIKLTDAAPAGDYISSNATIEGRAKNRSVLIETTRRVDFAPQVVKGCIVRPPQAATYPLLGAIPNDPDYRKHVPINYRLDARKIIAAVARDIKSSGEKAHFWIEMVHLGITAAEIIAEASALVGLLAIASPILAVAGNFLMLGIPCMEAAREKGEQWARTGFSRGVVIGANRRSAKLLKDYFGNDYFPPNPTCFQERGVAIANYKIGLLVGYVNGRLLCPNQHVIFWRDLGRRMGNQSYRSDQKRWGRREWLDWYVSAAAAFQKDHLR